MDDLFDTFEGLNSVSDNVTGGAVGGYKSVEVAEPIKEEEEEGIRGKKVEVSELDRKLQLSVPPSVSFASSPSRSAIHSLFYLASPLGEDYCGHAFGLTGGIPRFCCREVVSGTNGCVVVKHAKTAKAVVAASTWFVTVGVGTGPRAALTLKCVAKEEIPESLWPGLDHEEHDPEEWDRIFDEGRLSKKLGPGVLLIPKDLGSGDDSLLGVFTPNKKKLWLEEEDDEDSWLAASPGLEPLASVLGPKKFSWSSEDTEKTKFSKISEALYKTDANFSKIEAHQTAEAEGVRESVTGLGQKLNSLGVQTSALRYQLGKPDSDMKENGVTNPFDGLRHLAERMTNIDHRLSSPFTQVSYSEVVARLGKAELTLNMFSTGHAVLIPRLKEVQVMVDKLTGQTVSMFKKMIGEYLKPFGEFYKTCMKKGPSIFDRIASIEKNMARTSIDAQTFGSIRFPSNDAREDQDHSNEAPTSLAFEKVMKRMNTLERRNVELSEQSDYLQRQLEDQKWSGGRGSDPASARFSEGTSDCLTVDLQDLVERLKDLESNVEGSETVRKGGFTFSGVEDCEKFLRNHVEPGSFMAYDMVSLVHRSGAGSHSTIAENLNREHQVGKGGFKSMHSAYIYTSMKQPLPEVLDGETSATDPLPIPKLKSYEMWDKGEGTRGLRYEITNNNQVLLNSITSRLAHGSRGRFHDGQALFRSMIVDSQYQWKTFAAFISEKRNSCEQQTGDAKEAWLYPTEVAKGVFDELHKARCIGAERDSVDEMGELDEARMLWGALLCHKMIEEFILCSFVGHPRLTQYSIQHLFKNRVKQNEMTLIKKDVVAIKSDVKGIQTKTTKLLTKAGLT
jgi:hypothetical protein